MNLVDVPNSSASHIGMVQVSPTRSRNCAHFNMLGKFGYMARIASDIVP